jgi:hypothetical protein
MTTATDTTYNGWTNYATWRVNLEVFDGLDIRDHFDDIPSAYDVAQWAQGYAEELLDSAMREPVGIRSRMLTPCDIVDGWARAFLSDVDWASIARHLLDDVQAEAA